MAVLTISRQFGAGGWTLGKAIADRLKFMEKSWKISRKEAAKAIQTREKRRDAFLKYFKQGHPNSLSLYHLIINTSKMDFNQVKDVVTYLVKNFEEKNKE